MRGAGSPIVSMPAPDTLQGVSLGLLLLGNVVRSKLPLTAGAMARVSVAQVCLVLRWLRIPF